MIYNNRIRILNSKKNRAFTHIQKLADFQICIVLWGKPREVGSFFPVWIWIRGIYWKSWISFR